MRNDASVGKVCGVSSCELSVWRRFLVFLVGVSIVLGVSGCADSPSDPEPTVTWSERETPDIVTIAVPKGWFLVSGKINPINMIGDCQAIRGNLDAEGITIFNQKPFYCWFPWPGY